MASLIRRATFAPSLAPTAYALRWANQVVLTRQVALRLTPGVNPTEPTGRPVEVPVASSAPRGHAIAQRDPAEPAHAAAANEKRLYGRNSQHQPLDRTSVFLDVFV